MCFDLDSPPPIPVIAGAAVSHEDLELEAARRQQLRGLRRARRTSRRRVGVVVLPDVRGLYRFYEELALRFAERGYAAVAIDYFGRTAGVGKRDDDFAYMEHVAQTTPEGIQADVAAARRLPPRARRAQRGLHGRLLLRRPQLVARRRRRPRARRRDRLLRHRRASATASRARPQRAARDARRRSSRCRRATTQNITAEDERGLRRGARRRPGSSTSSSPTTARRTASSTASTRSSPRRPTTPGGARSPSSSATRVA